MKDLKWLRFGILRKKDSNTNIYIDGFLEGYVNGFTATPSPVIPKKYGQIAQEIQQKQMQTHKQINTNHQKQRISLKNE
ncbi:hypothetical protein [Helicobacter turcicus]|uniref:Uncharacterized protein n=1 Tax=Helicobacter turcicus TaxID=2867412 RepID=A0ABS7JLF3_9HELI|nr:hypothetical protein [Helicobacter turcicus]MBX7490223.1 hypothetical protein [Helicobacter turcicus]MBX7545198.1 hypothetical protein [Helicobacter turcicus]